MSLKLTELIQFLFNFLASSCCGTVALSKINYTYSICHQTTHQHSELSELIKIIYFKEILLRNMFETIKKDIFCLLGKFVGLAWQKLNAKWAQTFFNNRFIRSFWKT